MSLKVRDLVSYISKPLTLYSNSAVTQISMSRKVQRGTSEMIIIAIFLWTLPYIESPRAFFESVMTPLPFLNQLGPTYYVERKWLYLGDGFRDPF